MNENIRMKNKDLKDKTIKWQSSKVARETEKKMSISQNENSKWTEMEWPERERDK